jgi:hypothetical protein
MHMKTVLRHLCIWILWFYGTSFYSFSQLKKEYMLATLCNFVISMGTFYASLYIARRYNDSRKGFDADSGRGLHIRIARKIFRWDIPVILIVLSGVVLLSWLVDSFLYSIGKHPGVTSNFWYYAEGKFARAAFYSAIAYVMADKQYAISQRDCIILEQRERMRIVVREKNNVVNLYNQEMKGMKAILKKLQDRDSETGTGG